MEIVGIVLTDSESSKLARCERRARERTRSHRPHNASLSTRRVGANHGRVSRRLLVAIPFAALLGAAACQTVDVGQPCDMNLSYPPPPNGDGGPIAVPQADGGACSAESADFLRSAAYECEGLVCLQSPTGTCSGQAATPYRVRSYCSKACVSDSDCQKSQTGLVCRRVVLDPSFVASLPDGGAPYLPAALQSNYCAPPAVE